MSGTGAIRPHPAVRAGLATLDGNTKVRGNGIAGGQRLGPWRAVVLAVFSNGSGTVPYTTRGTGDHTLRTGSRAYTVGANENGTRRQAGCSRAGCNRA
ncbi:hypothetical protein [Streptomyces albicerus]|uniref:hypothetical protein n=1 Tax=Streptomyces albicerus TaxID=2569859 RepID=UPI00124B7546|nr:hypothetical protein [Streptomyces albicerus]